MVENLEEQEEVKRSRRKSVAIGVVIVLVFSLAIGYMVNPTDASETPRTMLADKLVLIAVDTDGDGNHDLEIAVSEIINIASFDDGTQGIWIGGDVTSLDPLSLTD